MKLERVVLRGFLSHHDTDWSPNGARLVSLVGPNGAGKSTLASDALRYALFDEARGRSDDVVTLGATDASVLVEFTYNGYRYRVTRGRTTKAGGKSSLELAIQGADGGWLPLTRDTIRETEAAIVELLRLDADTFGTAVLLGQGQANRFAEATAADRKRILSTVLGLDVYAAAEGRARELARDLDATVTADRGQLERLEEASAGADQLDQELDSSRGQLALTVASIETARAEREVLESRIRELDAKLAAAEMVAGQIAGLEADRNVAAEAWRRARDRENGARGQTGRIESVLGDAKAVTDAVADLPAARAALEALVAGETEERRLAREIADAERSIRELRIPHEQAVATWTARHDAATAKAAELEAHGKAGTSVCVTCGQPIEQDQALEQLWAARAAMEALGDAPQAPVAIALAEAAKVRLEIRQSKLAWDPATLVAARDQVATLERLAARADDLARAAEQLTREHLIATEAEAEKAQLADQGAAIAARLEQLRTELAGAEPIRAERSAATGDRERVIVTIDQLESGRRQLERAIAAAEAKLEQLQAAAADAARIRETIAAAETELGRLRRLVQAFGVTGIPARIIEGVLPELAGYANELLAELRPGMTLELRAQRAKKSGDGVVEALDLIVRDPAGERPLAMFSGGERMSVSLAIAVALSRLVARRAGARIESLIVDEPDGLDADARRAFGQALRVIAHRGELSRVVLVSHHDDLAEFADEIYSVHKGPAGSVVELVA